MILARRLWCILVFCTLTLENSITYEKHWSTPWRYVSDAIVTPMPGLHIWLLDALILGLLLLGRSQPGALRGRAKPVDTALTFSIAAILLWATYGALTGGSVLDERLQLHVIVMTMVTSFMVINVMRTPEHFRMLGRTVIYAGLFRFAMMFAFYILVMRSLKEHMEEVTDHGDSVLFVSCIVIVFANALHKRTRKSVFRAVFITALMLWCIQINARRLAWVGLVGSIAVMYALLRNSPLRRKIHRYALYVAPVALLYVGIGWSHPTGIFKPLASLQSVGDANNPSTQSRILEDIGLVVTLQGHPVIGTGFGHKYVEVSDTFAPHGFLQYRYVPHNSVLGLVAFSGTLGFIGIWMVFPVAAYLGARTYAFARSPLEKTIAMASVCVVFIHINQMWGDIGINAPQGLVLVSAAIAAASRMSVATGAWPGRVVQKRIGRVSAMKPTEPMTEAMPGAPSWDS